jgi:hypothetical protein
MSKLNQNTKFILWASILQDAEFRLNETLIGKDPEAAQNVNVSNALRGVKAVKDAIKDKIDVKQYIKGDFNESK